jgi:hypothetical protein
MKMLVGIIENTRGGPMNDDDRTKEALFRHAVLGDLGTMSITKSKARQNLIHRSNKKPA